MSPGSRTGRAPRPRQSFRGQEGGHVRQPRLMLLGGACLVAVLTIVTTHADVPHVRIVLGILMVLFVPGFSLVCAVLPQRQLTRGERLLASVGMSLAVTVCASVALAAAPIGLSRQSVAVALGVFTLVCSVLGRLPDPRRRPQFGVGYYA